MLFRNEIECSTFTTALILIFLLFRLIKFRLAEVCRVKIKSKNYHHPAVEGSKAGRLKTIGEFTQYPFFVRFRPFFYVFASP